MSDKKQTAVEWLHEALSENVNGISLYILELLEQAKAMEKQMIIDAYKADMHPCSDEDAEQYYTENYKP